MSEVTSFSLIVTAYDSEAFIGECLDSIAAQEYDPAHFEIICIDDGSRDHTPRILQAYRVRVPNLISFRVENSGLEKACNRGIREAKFDRIIRVDSDDSIRSNLLKRMNEAIHEQPEFDFYYCKNYLEYYSEEKQYPKELPDFDPEEIFERGDFFATGTVYKKSDLAEVGFFPEHVTNCGLENYTVILALLTRGKKGCPVTGTSFRYRRHPSNMSLLKRNAIIGYGKELLKSYGLEFRTNPYHPYHLKLEQEP